MPAATVVVAQNRVSSRKVWLRDPSPGPPGGRPRVGEGALTGPLTLASLSALRFDTAVLGCCGLTAGDGMTAYDLDEAAVKRAVITSARRIIAAADGSELGRTTHAYVEAPTGPVRSGRSRGPLLRWVSTLC